ncbi:hypothetical protein G6F40_017920 [Rhizopus arrhizus]|nr:hypothetical protein G6F40_017920 [Rhizopus arrhizus]
MAYSARQTPTAERRQAVGQPHAGDMQPPLIEECTADDGIVPERFGLGRKRQQPDRRAQPTQHSGGVYREGRRRVCLWRGFWHGA